MKKKTEAQNWFSLIFQQASDVLAKEFKKFQKDLNNLYRDDLPPEQEAQQKTGWRKVARPYVRAFHPHYKKVQTRFSKARTHIRNWPGPGGKNRSK